MNKGIVITNRKEKQKQYYKENSDKIKLRKKEWREKNPEYHKKYRKEHSEQEKIRAKKWASSNLDRFNEIGRKSRLKKYGLTIEQYNEMLLNQKGVCGICFSPETVEINGKIKKLSVDHNHTTGKVRGLLCDNCNKTIGLLKECPLIAKSLADYLIKWNQ